MAPRLKASNNAESTLASGITNIDTTITVADSSMFPDEGPFRFSIDLEIMEATSINKVTHTFTGVLRGLEGSTATFHDVDAKVEHRFTSGAHQELADDADLQLLDGDLTSHKQATTVHDATPDATPDRIILRDGDGQAKVSEPTHPDHIARFQDITAENAGAETPVGAQSKVDTHNVDGAAHGGVDAAGILTKLKTVDGTGSGLDADLLDGKQGAAYSLVGPGMNTPRRAYGSTTAYWVIPGWNRQSTASAERVSVISRRYHFWPIFVAKQTTYSGIGVGVMSAGTSGLEARLGIYEWNNGVPGDLVLDAGKVSVDTTGTKSIVINKTLAPGLYFLVIAMAATPNSQATFSAAQTSILSPIAEDLTSNMNLLGFEDHGVRLGDAVINGFSDPCPALFESNGSTRGRAAVWLKVG